MIIQVVTKIVGHESRPLLVSIILHVMDSLLPRAVGTAVVVFSGLHPVADDLAPAMEALWGKRMNGALEAIKGIRLSAPSNMERRLVVISTMIAAAHNRLQSHISVRLSHACCNDLARYAPQPATGVRHEVRR